MDDDLNTSKALAVLFDLTNKANKGVVYAYTLLHKLATTLGFTFEKAILSEEELTEKLAKISTELGESFNSMDEIIEKRKTARAEKDWETADKIRITLDKEGIILKDTKDGTSWEVKN
jgi:cysteinyl-tRNA synthetase